jgi:type IV fimbrial biogenesis protein FimT
VVIQRNRRSRGITLIELMIVVVIVAAVAALGAPSMRTFFINNRLDTANSEFLAALNLARNEAMRRGAPVSIRRLSATASDWTQGWEIFVDIDRNGARDAANPQEELIRVGPPLAPSLTLYASQVVATFVQFNPDGRIPLVLDDGSSPLSPRATFIICYDGVLNEGTQTRSRAVLLNSAGRARPGVDVNKNGRPENASGGDIRSCTNPT